MNALSNRISGGFLSGEILINGIPRPSFWKHMYGYVEQVDLFYDNLTVRETLEFAVKMRPRLNDEKSVQERVDEVLRLVGLEYVQHTIIGNSLERGISVGERKRLSIALELVNDPKLLFLDGRHSL